MDNTVKQRVIGAVVLVALAVIFVPMLLEKSEDDLGPVGGNLPDQPDQIVNDRIEPLTLPEPPPETEPAQVVLDQPATTDATGAGTAEPAAAMPPASVDVAPTAPTPGSAEETVTASQPEVPVPTAPAAAPIATPTPASSAPATAPVAPAPAKVLSGWVVQLASLASKSNAMALQEKLRGLGYTAFVEEIKMPQGVLYRVRIGPELERSNAENLRNRLEQQVQIKGIVTRYP